MFMFKKIYFWGCNPASVRFFGLPWPSYSSLDVPFPSSHEATIAMRSLSPDREPRKGGISKVITVSGSVLSVWDNLPVAHFQSHSGRALRSFLYWQSVAVFQEVERWWSTNPPGVGELVSGSSVTCHGDHGHVRSTCCRVMLHEWFGTLCFFFLSLCCGVFDTWT